MGLALQARWGAGRRRWGGLIRLYFIFFNISSSGFEQAGVEVERQELCLVQVRDDDGLANRMEVEIKELGTPFRGRIIQICPARSMLHDDST